MSPSPDISRAPHAAKARRPGVLAWPAWLRVLAVLPALALLWLGVWWATVEVMPL